MAQLYSYTSSTCTCSKMKPEIGQYFEDVVEYFRKQQKTMLQILEFQKKHRDRYVAQLKKVHAI